MDPRDGRSEARPLCTGGVRVKSILCPRDVQPRTLKCRMTPSEGDPNTDVYLVSKDGHSFTGVGSGDY